MVVRELCSLELARSYFPLCGHENAVQSPALDTNLTSICDNAVCGHAGAQLAHVPDADLPFNMGMVFK